MRCGRREEEKVEERSRPFSFSFDRRGFVFRRSEAAAQTKGGKKEVFFFFIISRPPFILAQFLR